MTADPPPPRPSVDDVALMPAGELVRLYRARRLSPVEATRATLARIEAADPILNAFCHLDPEAALEAARESEARWMRGDPLGLVDGVPTTIKDQWMVRGWPTRKGSATTDPGPSPDEAPAAGRLREHGAVLLGKTTMPEYGWKGVTDSPLHGVSRNPWNPARTCGGSSGGAAIAAAVGMGALNLGSDGAGSIRMPAGFCGVYGLKPTYARVPAFPYGLLPMCSHTGPMTRTVADAALMLTVMAEPDPRDWLGLPYDGRDWRIGIDSGVRGLRIAYSATLGYGWADPEIADLVARAARVFEELGATVEAVDPGFAEPRHHFTMLYKANMAASLKQLGPDAAARMDPGYLRMAGEGAGFSAVDLLEGWGVRDAVGRAMNAFHETYDLLLTPLQSVAAFEAGAEVPAGRDMAEWFDWSPFCYPFNWTGQPAASVPCGFTAEGLPAALQIVGPRYGEGLVLRASRAYESAHPFRMPGTGGIDATE